MILLYRRSACFYFVIFLAGIFSPASGQSHVSSYRELLIEVPQMNAEKSLPGTVTNLVALGGIHYIGYCDQMKCLLLKADESVHANNVQIMNKLKDLNIPFLIKPTGKISQVLAACKDPVQESSGNELTYPDK